MWSRKYVLLVMQYFLEICDDDIFADEIIKSMEKQVDCIMDIIGDENGNRRYGKKIPLRWSAVLVYNV